MLTLMSNSEDGRQLVVEVLKNVHGLDQDDLNAVVQIEQDDITYRLLDPVAMLKAKAANVRDINQAGPPPRQDREHLKIIAQCVPFFLRDAHNQAVANTALHDAFSKTLSRTFKTLSHSHTLKTLLREGVAPVALVPAELRDSPIEKIRTTCQHQMPRLEKLIQAQTA
jgi:hypothetical protein